MEQQPSVILGKPMRKYKSSLITEDDVTINTEEVNSEVKEITSPISPSKPVKTLLEERFDSKQFDSIPNQPEIIGVDKRLLLSALSSNKMENRMGCCWTPYSYIQPISDSTMAKIRKNLKILVEGSNIPPLALKFKDMRIPYEVNEYLENVKKIY